MVLVAFPKPTSFEEVQLVKLEQLLIHQILVRQTMESKVMVVFFFSKKKWFPFLYIFVVFEKGLML